MVNIANPKKTQFSAFFKKTYPQILKKIKKLAHCCIKKTHLRKFPNKKVTRAHPGYFLFSTIAII